MHGMLTYAAGMPRTWMRASCSMLCESSGGQRAGARTRTGQSDGAPTHNYRHEVRTGGDTEVLLVISVIVGVWVDV